jgi:H+/Cl- antiporter ClcA
MNVIRYVLISVTFIFAAIFTFNVYIWSQEYKDTFLYNNDILSFAMVFLFVIALTGVFKWLLHEEIVLTQERRRKR